MTFLWLPPSSPAPRGYRATGNGERWPLCVAATLALLIAVTPFAIAVVAILAALGVLGGGR